MFLRSVSRHFCKLVPQPASVSPLKRIKQRLGRKVVYRLLTAATVTGVLVAYRLMNLGRTKHGEGKIHSYIQPSEVLELGVNADFRSTYLIGVVKPGSLVLDRGTLKHHFTLTDFIHEVRVHYTGTLPSGFREAETSRILGEFVDPYNPKEFVAVKVESGHDAERPKTEYKPRSTDIDISERGLGK